MILTLGDSSIFGDGVEDGETLHDRLGLALSKRRIGARTGTVAIPGYSTVQTTVVMEEIGWAQAPDLIVIGNLWSDCNLDAWRDEALLAALGRPMARLERLLAHSALFVNLRTWVNHARGRPVRWKVSWPTPGATGLRRVPLERYVALLNGLLDEASTRGAGAVFLGLTDKSSLAAGEVVGECAVYVEAQRALAEARGVPLLDALALLGAADQSGGRLLQDQVHPTALGMDLLARGLADRLVEEGWPAERLIPGPSVTPILPEDPLDGQLPAKSASMQLDMLER